MADHLESHLTFNEISLCFRFTALYLIKNGEVQAIIGPQNSMQAKFVIDLWKKAQVPIISFSATSPSLTWF
jgi:ABC-type branched-subunit amino acid transport system substrate-binding protein